MLEKNRSLYFTPTSFEHRTKLALNWIQESIQAHQDRGSAAYAHLIKGWAYPYPETSGYIIPTLLHYHDIYPSMKLVEQAKFCANWLCKIQDEDGSFPGGLYGEKHPPIIFDMGQILLGLSSIYKKYPEDYYKIAIQKLFNRLIEDLDEDYVWRKKAYIPNYIPSYYTRVVWAVLLANQISQDKKVDLKMEKALAFYHKRVQANLSVNHWAFEKHLAAPTHTIAYTMRGFYESGQLLKNEIYVDLVQQQCDLIIKLMEKHGKLAGSYQQNWEGNYHFACLTGNCQLSILFSKIYKRTQQEKYLKAALKVLEPAFKAQFTSGLKIWKGAIPGSSPIWGPYQRFRFPNWASKFFLDACMELNYILYH